MASEQPQSSTGTFDAAVLMLLFGEEAAAAVLRHLPPAAVQQLGSAIVRVDDVSDRDVDRIVEGFLTRIAAENGLAIGRSDYVRNIMTQALGADRAQSVLGRITPGADDRPIALLDWMDTAAVHQAIADEHPQIMALVIACLPGQQGADVLALLPEHLQPDVVRRVAQLGAVPPEALRELELVLHRKFQGSSGSAAAGVGGVRTAARLLNHARDGAEGRILRDLRKTDRDLTTAIEDNMFVFDNLVKSDDRSLQTLLRGVETDRLALALKGADELVRARLLSCLSTRAANGVRDEMQASGPVRLSEVVEAQKQIVAIARRMADEGTIILAGRGGEELI